MLSNLPLKIFLAVVVLGLVGCYGIRCVVFAKLENKLPEILQELEQRHISAKIQTIQTSWYDNRIVLKGISLSNQEPNSLPLSISDASISSITLTGVELIPLLVNKNIKLDSVLIGNVKVTKYKTAKTGKANKPTERTINLSYVRIDSLEITDLDSLDKVVSTTRLSFETKDLKGTIPLTELAVATLRVHGGSINLEKSNYLIRFDEARLENMNRLTIDSLKIIPMYGKREFIKRAGYQTDRIECVFPSIVMDGINHEALLANKELNIHQISMSFELSAYRDKRMKDRHTFKALPDSLLRKIPFAVLIDSIKVLDSQITYEEVAEKADSSGYVQFKNLEAVFYNVSNRDSELAMRMKAHAKFMNDGAIAIKGSFSNSNKPHYIEGSLRNFRLPRLNQMLKPATGVSIESGNLDLLTFSFRYTDHHSEGDMTLNYHDLKLMSFREGKNDKAVPNVMKTLLINALIEDDLDKNDPRPKRKGEIYFVRNREKFIFNYWWKSLLSGLKSATGLPETSPKKEEAS